MNLRIIAFTVMLGLAVAGPIAADTSPLAVCTEHRISLSVRPVEHMATISDSGILVCNQGWNLLYLKAGATMGEFSVDGRPREHTYIADGDTTKLPLELQDRLADPGLRTGVAFLLFESETADTVPFHISFAARFEDPVENVQFSREKVGNEVNGTILDQGAYLSTDACYYPQGTDTLAHFALTADIPSTWESIADGNPMSSEVKWGRKVQCFENPFRADGYVFMAAPYVVRTVEVDSIKVATYFFETDTSLCDKYLTASADYIRMYQDLIGPYPFTQFTVAENFFPTGYGMPGWTLLGQTVLRLPFIVTSSLGHEVLHNWWGNSVYVDYDRGNWCEAAAVYGADYRYKLLASADAARDYRKDILKEYLSYVTDGSDFPIRQFTSRSSAETRTIGYNKAMMVFHLIEQQIGSEPFFEAWKRVYRDYQGRAISWEEWIDAFQETSGQYLGYVIPQWIDRAGAPQLGLDIISVERANSAGKKTVSLKITQSAEAPYRLVVPIRAEGPDIAESTTVVISAPETSAEFFVPAACTSISVDPDYHLFRRLYPEEMEPIISAVLGVDRKSFVSYEADESARQAFGSFGSALAEDSVAVLSANQLDATPRGGAPIVLNPTTFPKNLAGFLQLTADSVTIGGQSYSRAGHTVVIAGQNWNRYEKYLVMVTSDYASLPRLGQLVPHYGKYSYLVFAGDKNVAKGQWPVTESPLRKSLR